MKKYPVVIDLETKHTFREFSDPKKLGISVISLYDYRDRKGKVFIEKELNLVFPLLENSSYIIGFNHKSFDLAVLQAYYPGNVEKFPVFDILEDIKNKIGKRLSLNDIVYATLGKKKTGHGLMAIDLYKEEKWDELKRYCLDDTLLTKELFEYGAKNGEINYLNEQGKLSLSVDWKRFLETSEESSDIPLTLPF